MAHTPQTPQNIALGIIGAIGDNCVMAPRVRRDIDDQITRGGGGHVRIRTQASLEADDFLEDGKRQIKRKNIEEGFVDVKLDKLPDVSVSFTAEELFTDWNDVETRVMAPMGEALARFIDRGLYGLRADVTNSVTFDPAKPRRSYELVDEKLIGSTGAADFVISPRQKVDTNSFPDFYNADKVGDEGTALRESSLGRISGFNLIRGDYLRVAQTVKAHEGVNGAAVAQKTLAANTGVAFRRDAFTLVTKKLPSPVSDSGPAINEYLKQLGNFSATVRDDSVLGGLGIRLVGAYDLDSKTFTFSADAFVGFKTLSPARACLLVGASADAA